MKFPDDRRTLPRLRRGYPVRVARHETDDRATTDNVSARGVYLRTLGETGYEVGEPVTVVISVEHAPDSGGDAVTLELEAEGRVVRVDDPGRHRYFGEDGRPVTGVAIALAGPLALG